MDKKQISIFVGSVFLLCGMLAAGVALCSSSLPVSVTVTAKNISVTVTDASVAFGTLQLSTAALDVTSSTEHGAETQTITNNGTEAENIGVYCSDADGGIGWQLAAATGANAFVMQFATTTAHNYADNTFNVDNTTVSPAFPGLAAGATGDLDLKISMPESSDTQEKTITVTVVAIETA